MANSQGRVSVCLYYNIVWKYNITYFIWLTAKVEFQYVYIRILQYRVKVQYNVRTLYD